MLTPADLWTLAPRAPRKWHVDALPIALDALRNRKRGVVYAATGSGKSYLQGAIMRAGSRIPGVVDVMVVPTEPLVDQMTEDVRPWGLKVGQFYGKRKKVTNSDVVIVCRPSVDALACELAMRGLRCRLAIVDECHGLGSAKTMAAMGALKPTLAMGFSATPIRSDDVQLHDLWPAGMLVRYTMRDAIRDGAVVQPLIRDWVGQEGEDPNVAMLHMLRTWAVDRMVVDAIDVKDAEFFAGWLTANDWPALHIHGQMSVAEKRERIAALYDRKVRTLVHVKLLTEGVNLPWLSGVGLRVQSKSRTRLIQYVGRALRTWEGKEHGLVLDITRQTEQLMDKAEFSTDMWDAAEVAAAEEANKLTKKEAAELERLVDAAKRRADDEAEIAKVWAAFDAAGLIVRDRPAPSMFAGVTPAQAEVLTEWAEDGHKSPMRYLPKEFREMAKRLLLEPYRLTRRSASEMIEIGQALRMLAGRHKRATGGWWGGMVGLPVADSSIVENQQIS